MIPVPITLAVEMRPVIAELGDADIDTKAAFGRFCARRARYHDIRREGRQLTRSTLGAMAFARRCSRGAYEADEAEADYALAMAMDTAARAAHLIAGVDAGVGTVTAQEAEAKVMVSWLRARMAGSAGSQLASERPLDVGAVADRLGVKIATVWQWGQRNRLPPADGTISGSPWWWPDTIEVWAAETGRGGTAT